MIQAFGNFVVGGNYIIGAVIFLVLIAIQYVVINHGAVRISEVTARFTLDALPGKQMSIDSDLSSGLIDETEARRRRKELASEAEFYGAMDGASRFTQRDAVAGILITGINIIAGFLIGVLQHGMDLRTRHRNLHRADHRRRPGDGDPGPDDLHFGRPDRHPRQLRRAAGHGFQQAALRQPAAAVPGERRSGGAGDLSRAAHAFRSWCMGSGLGAVAWQHAARSRPRSQRPKPRPSRRRAKDNLETPAAASSPWPSRWGWAW